MAEPPNAAKDADASAAFLTFDISNPTTCGRSYIQVGSVSDAPTTR